MYCTEDMLIVLLEWLKKKKKKIEPIFALLSRTIAKDTATGFVFLEIER